MKAALKTSVLAFLLWTAVAMAQLWERGLLELDDRVVRFIPEFGQMGKEPITIRHILTHTGGFRAAPRLLGAIEYQVDGEEPTTVATLHEFIGNEGDAWTALQARLGEYFAAAVTGLEPGRSPDPTVARSLAAVDVKEARVLGELTGALHTWDLGSFGTLTPPMDLGLSLAANFQHWQISGIPGAIDDITLWLDEAGIRLKNDYWKIPHPAITRTGKTVPLL